jgi:CPA2 family monovalent cation:H+ antiporter-2
MGVQAGINTTVILQNRGEFALILATLSISAGLDERIQPFAGLYVLIMAVLGPILAANSEKIGGRILRTGASKRRRKKPKRDPMLDEEIALVEAATADLVPDAGRDDRKADDTTAAVDRLVEQAMLEQSASGPGVQQEDSGDRKRD